MQTLEEKQSPTNFCSNCGAFYPKRLPKFADILRRAGIVATTIIIQIMGLAGAGILGAAAITANNLALGLLAIPAVVGLFSYVIGGNKVTYRFVKSLVAYAEKENQNGIRRFNWKPMKEAVKGDGFMVGVALFVTITLISFMAIIVGQLGDLEDGSFNALAKMAIIPVLLVLMLPLIGLAAKLVGNEKAAAECGFKPGGVFFLRKSDEGSDVDSGNSQSDTGNGEGGFSF